MRKKMSEREKAHRALARRRHKIVDEVRQLKRDVDWYNANNPHGAVVEMDFDLTEDVAKARAAEQRAKGAQ